MKKRGRKKKFNKIGLNIEVILRNAENQMRTLVPCDNPYCKPRNSTISTGQKRLHKKEAAYISR